MVKASKAKKSKVKLVTKADHSVEVARLYGQGYTQVEIAEEMTRRGHKMNQSMVSNTIKAVVEHWKKDAANEVMERRLKELAGIDQAETIAWREWEFSQQRRVLIKGNPKAKDPEHRVDRVIMERCKGDPVYFELAMDCKEKRMKLLRLVDPGITLNTTENTVNQNTFNIWKSVEELSPDPLKVKLMELEQSRVTVIPEEQS